MDTAPIINELKRNKDVFASLLRGLSDDMTLWKPVPEKWCLREVICHLYDEEREDFRARVKHILDTPNDPMPPINPAEWVTSRKYMEQDHSKVLEDFLQEREASVAWLHSLRDPKWENAYQHPKVGPVTARLIFVNWLAHDHLHLRQIIRIKYQYLAQQTKEKLDYAGEW